MRLFASNAPAGGRRLWLALATAAALALVFVLSSCNECMGSVYSSGEDTLDRRRDRDRSFEEAEPSGRRRGEP